MIEFTNYDGADGVMETNALVSYNESTSGFAVVTRKSTISSGAWRPGRLNIAPAENPNEGVNLAQLSAATNNTFPRTLESGYISAQTDTGTIAYLADTGSSDALYEVGGWVKITSVTGATLQLRVSYQDFDNAAQTLTFTTVSTTPIANLTSAATYHFPVVKIPVKASGDITLEVVKTVAGVSVTYNAGGDIKISSIP
jgi:hypothetical protein